MFLAAIILFRAIPKSESSYDSIIKFNSIGDDTNKRCYLIFFTPNFKGYSLSRKPNCKSMHEAGGK